MPEPRSNPEVVDRLLGPDPDGAFPNHPKWPLLVYRSVVSPEEADPDAFEDWLEANGWPPGWRYGVFPFHHYHSNAHEALAVYDGSAEIQFGGPSGPVLPVEAGDVAILPAGTTHKRVDGGDGFRVVGAYPEGQEDYDLLRGESAEERAQAEANIAAVPRPEMDPIYGTDGPLLEYWPAE